MNSIVAKEARELAKNAQRKRQEKLKEEKIKRFPIVLENIFKTIEERAKEGKTWATFNSHEAFAPFCEERHIIVRKLEELGYKIKQYDKHERYLRYLMVSWDQRKTKEKKKGFWKNLFQKI